MELKEQEPDAQTAVPSEAQVQACGAVGNKISAGQAFHCLFSHRSVSLISVKIIEESWNVEGSERGSYIFHG